MSDTLTYITILAGSFVFGLVGGVFMADVIRGAVDEPEAYIISSRMVLDAVRMAVFYLVAFQLYRIAHKTKIGREISTRD